MGNRPKTNRWITNTSVVLALLIILCAMAVSLYLLVDHHASPQEDELQALRRQIDDTNRRVVQLQQSTLPTPQSADKQSAAAYEQDLKQHELLLNELRAEHGQNEERIKYSSDLLKEAKETEDRTRSAAALFIGIFGAVAAVLLGQSYWQFRGWKEQADEALSDVESVRPDIALISETRESLENKLPKFIEEVQHELMELKGPTGPALPKMHEIDHLAYLSNPEMRFKESRTSKGANQYLLALIEAARGHVLQKNYYGADRRLHEFFRTMLLYQDSVSAYDKAKAHSLRAFVYYRLLVQIASAPSWERSLRSGHADELRQQVFAEIKKSQACDKDWWHSYMVEALVYSRQFVPEGVLGQHKADMFLDGQRKAIVIYQKLIERGAGRLPDMGPWQNLACCLKRVADTTGEKASYDVFKEELEKFPNDLQIRQGFMEGGRSETEEEFLWQSMLQDEELFAKVDKINIDDYRKFWSELLTERVKLRDWQNDLKEIKKRAAPKMPGWIL